jgi:two-component system, response regulator PdtaR
MTEAAAPVRVLVADDDGEARALLVSMLSSLGHEVVAEVGTGRDAVAYARTHLPDVVLLDVHMPDGDGIEAAKQITGDAPATAVVLFTGDPTLALSADDVIETSAITMIPKPTPKATLDNTLRLAVARVRAFDAARREASDAKQALEDRKAIERAKGLLQRRTGCSEQEAYRILQRTSQDKSQRMVDVAMDVLRSEPGYAPSPPRR